MKFFCPNCEREIPHNNIDINTGLAQCGHCKHISKVSELPTTKEQASLTQVPEGGSIRVEKGRGQHISLILPAKGFRWSNLPLLFFVIFWLGFVGVWTSFALRASLLFALFSTPFWIAGLFMLRGLLNGFFESQRLELSADQMVIKKSKPLGSQTHVFNLKEIDAVGLDVIAQKSWKRLSNANMPTGKASLSGNHLDLPAIKSEGKTVFFFETATKAEQKWVTRLLRKMVDGQT